MGASDFDTDNKLKCCSEIVMTALIFEAYRAQIYHQPLFLRALLLEMQGILKQKLNELNAPSEQVTRLGLEAV